MQRLYFQCTEILFQRRAICVVPKVTISHPLLPFFFFFLPCSLSLFAAFSTPFHSHMKAFKLWVTALMTSLDSPLLTAHWAEEAMHSCLSSSLWIDKKITLVNNHLENWEEKKGYFSEVQTKTKTNKTQKLLLVKKWKVACIKIQF